MATELREARLRVVLDLDQAEGEQRQLDRDVDRTAQKQKRMREEEDQPARGKVSSRKMAIRQLTHGGLFQAVTNVLRSLPLGVGAGFAIGLGAAELNERFGPGLEAVVKNFLPEWIVDVLDAAGIDLEASAEMSRKWSEWKASLTSIGQAFEDTGQVIAARVLTGGTVTPQEATEEFGLNREMARFQIELAKTRRRIIQMQGGSGITKSIRDALEGSSLPSSVGK